MRAWEKLSIFLLCATLLCGCSAQKHGQIETEEPKDTSKVHLTMFGFKVGAEQILSIESVLNDFMKKNPDISITYEGLSNQDGYLDVLYNRLESGTADDIFMLNPNAFAEMDRRGYIGSKIFDLSSTDNISNYNDTIQQLIHMGDQVPGVPLAMGSYGIFVNVDKLNEYGLSIPVTLDEFLNCCSTIRSQGEIPIAASLKDEGYAAKIIALGRFLAVHDLEDNRTLDYDAYNNGSLSLGEDLREGFQLIDTFCQEGYWDTEKALTIPAWTSEVNDFTDGSHAFLLGASWSLSQIWKGDPSFHYEFVALPLGTENNLAIIKASLPICVNAKSAHLKEALQFIDFVSEPEVVDLFTNLGVALSPLKNGKSSVDDLNNISQTVSQGRASSAADPRLHLDLETTAGKLCAQIAQGTITVDEAVENIDRILLGEADNE